ncbi:MAG: LacI family DNA-binding transcriptional regulator [Anaerolineales bacterium]|jgi:DNA-binding LacI/PurR family transcriptional regulator
MRKRVTARDVADRAGVSRTTVSFVLNNVPGMRISEETRQRVLEAARDIDYHPNISARRLVTGRSYIIAYVERQSPKEAFADAFFPEALHGVHDAVYAAGYEVLFAPTEIDSGARRCSRLLRGGHVDGIILSGPRADDEELRDLLQTNAPIVLQGHMPGVPVASVDVDNVRAASMAVQHLIDLGFDDICMIVHAPLAFTAASARFQGYQQTLEENGLAYIEDRIQIADFTPVSGEEAMERLVETRPNTKAIFISSDTVAIGAIRAARRNGLRVPEDIAVIGFDDIPMAVYNEPPLTTIRLPAYGIGWGAANLLMRIISGDEVRQKNVLLETDLVVRSSC